MSLAKCRPHTTTWSTHLPKVSLSMRDRKIGRAILSQLNGAMYIQHMTVPAHQAAALRGGGGTIQAHTLNAAPGQVLLKDVQ